MFADNLRQGQIGESYIARWLRRKGFHVLPAYEKEIDTGKGPRLFMADGGDNAQLIAPDFFVMGKQKFMWVEAKHKTVFSWYGIGGYFVTGIDQRHFTDYCRVADSTDIPVWILFLHTSDQTWPNDVTKWGAPKQCPVGLFGAEITKLRNNYSHKSDRHGASGMIYWQPVTHLIKIAELSELVTVKAATVRMQIAHA